MPQPISEPNPRDAAHGGMWSATSLAVMAIGAATVAVLLVGNPLNAEPQQAYPMRARSVLSPSPEAKMPSPSATMRVESATLTVTSPQPAPMTSQGSSPPAPSPPPLERPYVVQPGDTLTAVAGRFGVSPPNLAAANGLSSDARLNIGQTLRIPAGATGTSTPAAP